MFKHKTLTLIFFSLITLITGCEKDPLSQKGKIQLPNTDQQSPEQVALEDNFKKVSLVAETKEIPAVEKKEQPSVTTIDWEDLIPKEWRPDPILVEKYNKGEIEDDDPRIMALRDRLREMEKRAPINDKLDGQIIKMPGFVVPVETDGEIVHEFLLVPYHGACVHVPAPPANQIVYVKTTEQSVGKFEYFDTVWVTGLLTVEKTKSKVAESGYTITATKIELYK